MRKTVNAVGAGKTGLIYGVVVGQRGLSREGPLYSLINIFVFYEIILFKLAIINF